MAKQILIVGGGFAGLAAAKTLGKDESLQVTLVDRQNHHLFQPLLYQVAMAGLSPADIAAPIRSMLSRYKNVRVLQGEALSVDMPNSSVEFDFGRVDYDYLILACGARHSYFGKPEWEEHAPGLKTIAEATEIRRRVLDAFEVAERTEDPEEQRSQLTFVVVGGGPTGVELAGAIGEMSRYTLAKDFRRINPKSTRIILVEAGPRILASFSERQADKATRSLERLGVQVWTSTMVTDIDDGVVRMGDETIQTSTVLWAAGTEGAGIAARSGMPVDSRGRVLVNMDLTVAETSNVFVAGDLAAFPDESGDLLPGTAPVAVQQGRYIARAIRNELRDKARSDFRFVDKGQMATIGRSRAIVEIGKIKLSGWIAWMTWLMVHIYFLTGFKNRLVVVLQWAWSYITFRRGARLIVDKEWRSVAEPANSAV